MEGVTNSMRLMLVGASAAQSGSVIAPIRSCMSLRFDDHTATAAEGEAPYPQRVGRVRRAGCECGGWSKATER